MEAITPKLVGGFNPSEKYATIKLDHFPKVYRGENKTYFKSTPIVKGC